jgi:hypothetical protein
MKSPIVIKLNGTVITGRIDGTEQFTITWRENDDDGGLAKSYSSELRFYDDGYSILRSILIDNPNGFINEVDVEIFDECCGRLVFSGFISGNSVDWCEPECWVSASVVEKKEALNCVKSTLITDNHNGFLSQPQKKLRYCIETRPDFIYAILFLIYGILNTAIFLVLLPLSAVVVVIQSIAFVVCSVVCAVSPNCTLADCQGGTWTNPAGAFSDISGWYNDLRDRMIQCQWYHPTALVRDYIQNVCDKCGLTFQSSILNDPSSPYYNLLLFSAPVQRGYKPSDTEARLIEQNLPIESLDTLMTRHLNPIFNARYWIVGNTFLFERKDNFSAAAPWIDAEQLLNDGRIVENEICFSWIDKPQKAFAIYKYSLDAIDITGNEAGLRFEDIVEWNSPPSLRQKESLDVTLLSSMPRFRWDGAGTDNLEQQVYAGFIFALPFIPTIQASRGLLMMAQHTPSNYKFLIWNSASGDENARVQTNYDLNFTLSPVRRPYLTPGSEILAFFNSNNTVPPEHLFNYPMSFNNNAANNLYTLFHYIDNPRLAGTKLFNFNFTFSFDCGEYNGIDFSKSVRLRVGNNIKFGEIKELQIDFVKRTIGVSGIV